MEIKAHSKPQRQGPVSAWSALAVAIAMTVGALHSGVAAQEVREINLNGVPPDLVSDHAPASPSMAPAAGGAAPAGFGTRVSNTQMGQTPVRNVDLGAVPASSVSGAGALRTGMTPVNTVQPQQAASIAAMTPMTPALAAARSAAGRSSDRVGQVRRVSSPESGGDIERAVFQREPIRVQLRVGRERLITLPAPAALSVPVDMESVARIEIIDRTMYARALVPFDTLRIVAELVDTGQQIPLDIQAGNATVASSELEVSVYEPPGRAGASVPGAGSAQPSVAEEGGQVQPADMVQLVRHASRQLYAPRRLAWATPNVQQVGVDTSSLPALVRGADVDAVPLGQWRSGSLYVTAVRVTNRSKFPLELPLDTLRGRWISAAAQHGRLGPKGTDTDTTALYLVCDRSFDACR